MIRPDVRSQLQVTLPRIITANDGELPRSAAALLAETYGISPRTIYRVAADAVAAATATPDPRGTTAGRADAAELEAGPAGAAAGEPLLTERLAKWWDDHDARKEVLAALGGAPTVAAAWRQLTHRGLCTVSYPTFTRQLKEHLDPAVYAGLTAGHNQKGREAYIAAGLYCTEVTEGRNTRWQADVQYVPVRVRASRGAVVLDVFQVTFLDEATRRVMGTMFTTEFPTAQDVKATLVSAVMGHTDADGTFYGGVPESIRWDHGGEFLNETLTHTCAQLGIVPIPSPPYSGWRKGKIERFHRTMQQRFFATLPGATQGPKTFTGKRPWRGADADLLFFDSFVALALAGVEEYNAVHVHRSLGHTPDEAWRRDGAPVTRAPDAALHPLMLALPRHRVVGKDGISYDNVKYVAPALAKWRRRKVQVRVLPHDVERIFVFDPDTDQLICRATPAAQLTPLERQHLLRKRTEDYAEVRDAIAAGTAQREEAATIEAVLEAERALREGTDEATHPPRRRKAATPPPVPGDGDGADDDNVLGANSDDFLDLYGAHE